MTADSHIENCAASGDEAYAWLGRILHGFAHAEQAIGKLSQDLDFSISQGSLSSLNHLLQRLNSSDDRKAIALAKRIARWQVNRRYRNHLAHATIKTLWDQKGDMVFVTRHLPLDADDVSPDRVWTAEERKEFLRQVSNDSRSISDHVKNLLADNDVIKKLRQP